MRFHNDEPTLFDRLDRIDQVKEVGDTTAAGMLEASKTFRRLKAYRQLPILRNALQERLRNNTIPPSSPATTAPGWRGFSIGSPSLSPAMSLSLLKFVGQASLVDEAMLQAWATRHRGLVP